jgi:hypothetical protein
MTPPPTHPCSNCFLEEQREGRVCPAARDVYGLPDLEAQQNAEALRLAIREDRPLSTLADLVHVDAERRLASSLPSALPLALPPAANPSSYINSKEVIDAPASS